MSESIALPAPAKLNLFLHITARRTDGYHDLQTVFQFLDYADQLVFTERADNSIELSRPLAGVPPEDDLTVRAAKLLRDYTGVDRGVTISVDKILPMGGGLGGGSSNAATTLLALNSLWQLALDQDQLLALALKLGADVPVFVHGHACWAEGVGEKLTDLDVPEHWYVVVHPLVSVSTAELFAASELTRNCSPITIRDFVSGTTGNVFEPLVRARHPEVAAALDWLKSVTQGASGNADGRIPAMSGTGSCVFLSCQSREEAVKLNLDKPAGMDGFVARGQNESPLKRALDGALASQAASR